MPLYLGVYHFYEGPYPLFWSGLMKKGRLNPDLRFYLRSHRGRALLAEIAQVVEKVERRAAGAEGAPQR